MDCPHCGTAFHDDWLEVGFRDFSKAHRFFWRALSTVCPACNDVIIDLTQLRTTAQGPPALVRRFRVFPLSTNRKPTPKEVPEAIKEDYEEACKVLPISEKASAALSRRCLQAILREKGYQQHDLAKQIDALLNEADPAKAIPSGLRATVDVIRNFGNFSAHPITDQTTLQIIDVELGEAGWCLDILEEMFDHYYVKPAEAAARKAALDAKLKAAGKPPSK